MKAPASLMLTVFLPGALLAFLVPAIVFLVCALAADMSLADSLRETAAQFFVERRHLWGCGVLGVFPVVLLTGLGWLLGRRLEPQRTRRICLAGLLGIALVLVWVNMEFWPGYLPERAFLGFPHGLEFVIGPVFFAPPTMLVLMLFAWLATRPDAGP